MRIGYMGRSRLLLDTIVLLSKSHHETAFIWTSKAESYYQCDENEFQCLAQELACPFYFSPKVENIRDEINFEEVDVIISFNFVNIIPYNFLNNIKHGILNAHTGDLPRYKGNACPNWAILNGEDKVVLTIHEMSDELDSGPVYIQEALKLDSETDITEVYAWLEKVTSALFAKAIALIDEGVMPKSQKSCRALRTFPRKPQDSKIDWSIGVTSIHRLIRASSRPFSGAFCSLNDDENTIVRIYKAEVIELDYDFIAVDGQVLEKGNDFFCVSSRNRALKITDVAIDGYSPTESIRIITQSMRNRLT